MNAANPVLQRRIVARLSIADGNAVQIAGVAVAGILFYLGIAARPKPAATIAVLAAWTLLYLCCHGIAHWAVGRVLGIRFAFYTIGGTEHPEGYPAGLRWVFEHLPFFGVQTEKASMQKASPMAKAIMWSAGVTSSAVVPTLAALFAFRARVPGSMPFLIFAVFWALGTLSSNWRSRTGDYSKARRALKSQDTISK